MFWRQNDYLQMASDSVQLGKGHLLWVAWVGVGGGDDDGMDKLGWWSCKTRGGIWY